MPTTKLTYDKCYFYKIVCNDIKIKDLYVGHTTDFTKRKSKHKGSCENPNVPNHYNLKVYKAIRENGDRENWSMVMIEKYPCNVAQEAIARERLSASLNSNYPGRNMQEYSAAVKDIRQVYMKEYRPQYCENNKEIVNEKDKIYRESHKEQRKAYLEKNKVKIAERHRVKYQLKKNEIKEQKDETV